MFVTQLPAAPAAVPGPTGIQIATLVVASIAALGAVFAAIVISVATAKREKSAWLRQKQAEAYDKFQQSAWKAANRVMGGGEIATALNTPNFVGLEHREKYIDQGHTELRNALHDVSVVGQKLTLEHCAILVDWWRLLASLASPLPGTAHWAALEQRVKAINNLDQFLMNMATAMRCDLGVLSRQHAKKLRASELSELPSDHPIAKKGRGEAHKVLKEWLVRDWDGVILETGGHDTYVREDYPWSLLVVDATILMQPLAAVARKLPTAAWMFAIDSSITAVAVDEIEKDMVRLVTGHRTAWRTLHGGEGWVDGEIAGEMLFWWTMDEVPHTAPPEDADPEVLHHDPVQTVVDDPR